MLLGYDTEPKKELQWLRMMISSILSGLPWILVSHDPLQHVVINLILNTVVTPPPRPSLPPKNHWGVSSIHLCVSFHLCSLLSAMRPGLTSLSLRRLWGSVNRIGLVRFQGEWGAGEVKAGLAGWVMLGDGKCCSNALQRKEAKAYGSEPLSVYHTDYVQATSNKLFKKSKYKTSLFPKLKPVSCLSSNCGETFCKYPRQSKQSWSCTFT